MAAIDNLTQAVANLTTEVSKVIAEVASLKAQIANGSTSNDPAIQAAADSITGNIAQLDASL